jgi:hypothetical protein
MHQHNLLTEKNQQMRRNNLLTGKNHRTHRNNLLTVCDQIRLHNVQALTSTVTQPNL